MSEKKNVLLVGGAGYVGSVTTEQLAERGYHPVVLDNLYQGHRDAIHPEAEFIEGTISDEAFLDRLFSGRQFFGVMDFAGETLVEFSMTDPNRYFQANVVDGLKLLNAMVKHGVERFVFSSTSAIYGEPEEIPMPETHRKDPGNSYGESKLIFEQILKWYHRIHNLRSVCFRYFNAAGASERFGEDHRPETHLIPLVLQVALGQREVINIFGNDYPTKDGTCVRDYTHVFDLAQAHIAGLENADQLGHDAFNLGNGDGYTVNEVIQAARDVSGHPIPARIVPRRAGDVSRMVASSAKARKVLGWDPRYPKIHQMIETAWKWHVAHPTGYEQ
ncbi:MAG: UDP-glucose 4-epimerase GalE [Terrimicrobiaceae bacterium]|nr:UDP-glucose 4-epimerase GalE [Terrimicrobiaceae bacterium]